MSEGRGVGATPQVTDGPFFLFYFVTYPPFGDFPFLRDYYRRSEANIPDPEAPGVEMSDLTERRGYL